MNQPIKLLCTPQPLPDESFMGYIIRLSQENRCESLIWIFKLANIKTNPPNNKSNKLTETDYGNLSALTGLTINALKLLSFEVVESVAAACNAPHCQDTGREEIS